MQIYLITNLINGKIYVGQDSKNKSNYFGSGTLIKRAVKKYGKQNFKKDILETCNNQNILNESEKFWIQILKSQDMKIGYNIASGGEGGDTLSMHPNKKEIFDRISKLNSGINHFNFGKHLSNNTKLKIQESVKKFYKEHPEAKLESSNRMKGKYSGEKNPMFGQGHKVTGEKNGRFGGKGTTDETRKKLSNANKGRIHTDEAKANMSKAASGKNNSMYGRSAYSIWVEKYGKEEADRRKEIKRQKLSKATKGRKLTEEHKAKLRKPKLKKQI